MAPEQCPLIEMTAAVKATLRASLRLAVTIHLLVGLEGPTGSSRRDNGGEKIINTFCGPRVVRSITAWGLVHTKFCFSLARLSPMKGADPEGNELTSPNGRC